ncbi:MAG: threonine/serine exporter family protein [Butyricicoccus pullicaecorum]|nr:threonine/serine exporter family protein [Butyricicoccus pullicaecorum]MDO4668757.1 threonine/serine exporter family protein [Butyricicoccus pullicaecorum]
MEIMTGTELLNAALMVGTRLLACGAEIYRVEESVARICLAYGAKSADVYAVPTAIIATIQMDEVGTISQVCRITQRGTNINKVDALNTLCRSVCICPISYKQMQKEIAQIDACSVYSDRVLCLACGGGAMFFALLFGADLAGGILAFAIGFLLQIFMIFGGRLGMHPLFTNLFGGIWISFCALLGAAVGICANYDVVIIGSIMPLVPGLLMTNSIRDMIAGDFMAGISRFSEAFLIAAGIAAGAAIPLSMSQLLLGVF